MNKLYWKLQNEDTIRKAFETGEFVSGEGLLNPEQQTKFTVLIKKFNALMGNTRMERMKHAVKDIEKLHINEAITRGISEDTISPSPVKPKVNKVRLEAKKLISNWDVSTETFQENIEMEGFEDTLMMNLTQRIGVDLEQLAIMGDESIVPSFDDPNSLLLSSNDGWYKQSLETHVMDLEGDSISRGVFGEMLRMMPKQYRNDPGLRFIMSDTLVIDWLDLLSGGNSFSIDAGAIGSDQVAAQAFASMLPGLAPYGKQIVRANLIPDDLPISTGAGAASYAYLDGSQYQPYKIIPGFNDTLLLSISGSPVTPVVIPAKPGGEVLDITKVIAAINAIIEPLGGLAIDNGENKLRIRTKLEGVGTSVVLSSSASGSSANAVLGFPVLGATSSGLVASGIVAEGTFIWLVNLQNLAWGILDGTRIYTEYNKDRDVVETVVYNQLDFKIVNPDAMVLATGIRKRSLV